MVEPTEFFKAEGRFLKADDALGLVFGWAIVCKENGEPYFDTQGDHITEQAMLEATADFMQKSRGHKTMHEGKVNGTVVFAFPLTEEVAKVYGIKADRSGLMVAVRPDAETFKRWKAGEFTGFSIGGKRIEDKPA